MVPLAPEFVGDLVGVISQSFYPIHYEKKVCIAVMPFMYPFYVAFGMFM